MLTKEQAACIMAVTGKGMMESKYFLEAVSEKLGRQVYPKEFANEEFVKELQNLYYNDFIELCWEPPYAGLILPREGVK